MYVNPGASGFRVQGFRGEEGLGAFRFRILEFKVLGFNAKHDLARPIAIVGQAAATPSWPNNMRSAA